MASSMRTTSRSLPVVAALTLLLAGCPGGTSPTPPDTGTSPDVAAALPDVAPAVLDLAPAPAEVIDATPDAVEETAADPRPLACGTATPAALGACVDAARYQADLELVAAPRPPGSPHWQAVQDHCAATLAAAGFAVELHTTDDGGTNVIGTLPGIARADEHVVLSAHYDHIPGCAGADDNGTGTAGVLEAARALGAGTFERTLVLACWDREESGLEGSRAWAADAKAGGLHVSASLVFEMLGYVSSEPGSQTLPGGVGLLFPEEVAWLEARDYRGDFIALIADEASAPAVDAFAASAATIDLPALPLVVPTDLLANPLVSDLFRSDHAAFWEQGFPGVMLTDTANFRNPHYHCGGGPDVVADLDADFASRVVRAAVEAVATVAVPSTP